MSKIRNSVILLGCLLFFWNLGGHDLWAPDEPYFGEGAREMLADGHWWVPHVNGVVTTDKPPVFFWSIAAASLPLGEVTPWTSRLPSALAGLGVLLLVLRFGRRFASPESTQQVGWIAGVVLVTTVMFWEKARWAQIDALLCLLIWIAISSFEAWKSGEKNGRAAGIIFWLAAALAVLAKGPVGLLLPLGIALLSLATDRRLCDWKGFAPLTGPLAFFAVVGAWMLAATFGGDSDYSVWGALREHFVDRGLHGLHHAQPPWYFLEVLPVQLLPWSGLVPGALLLAWRRRRDGDRLLLTIVAFVVIFFSISTEKRELYALPAVPAFALLVGLLIDHLRDAAARGVSGRIDRRWLFGGQVAIGTLLLLTGIAAPIVAQGRDDAPTWLVVTLSVLLGSTGLATLWACFRRSVLGAALAPAVGFSVVYLFVASFVYPALEERKSARPFSLRMAEITEPSRASGHPVVAFRLSNLPEAFAFHSKGMYTITTNDLQVLEAHLDRPERVWAVVDRSGLDELSPRVRESLQIVEETRLSRVNVALVVNRPEEPSLP